MSRDFRSQPVVYRPQQTAHTDLRNSGSIVSHGSQYRATPQVSTQSRLGQVTQALPQRRQNVDLIRSTPLRNEPDADISHPDEIEGDIPSPEPYPNPVPSPYVPSPAPYIPAPTPIPTPVDSQIRPSPSVPRGDGSSVQPQRPASVPVPDDPRVRPMPFSSNTAPTSSDPMNPRFRPSPGVPQRRSRILPIVRRDNRIVAFNDENCFVCGFNVCNMDSRGAWLLLISFILIIFFIVILITQIALRSVIFPILIALIAWIFPSPVFSGLINKQPHSNTEVGETLELRARARQLEEGAEPVVSPIVTQPSNTYTQPSSPEQVHIRQDV